MRDGPAEAERGGRARTGDETAASQLLRLLRALQRAAVADARAEAAGIAAFGLSGLPYARAVGELLAQHQLGWADVLAPYPALARICGMLTSAHAGEQAAAYRHALGWLRRTGRTWLTVSTVPAVLHDAAPIRRRSVVPAAVRAPTPPDDHRTAEDWATILRWLVDAAAWRDPYERDLLHALERVVSGGGQMPAGYTKRVRDLLWFAETHGLRPREPTRGGAEG